MTILIVWLIVSILCYIVMVKISVQELGFSPWWLLISLIAFIPIFGQLFALMMWLPTTGPRKRYRLTTGNAPAKVEP